MPYNNTIKAEAKYVADRGHPVNALLTAILNKWFLSSNGYAIDHQVLDGVRKPNRKHFFVRPVGGFRDILLIVEHKPQAKWIDAGRQEVLEDLTEYIKAQFDKTKYSTIYGLAGIGLHCMICKIEKDGLPIPTILMVVEWHDDISSDLSYDAFETVAALVYNIH